MSRFDCATWRPIDANTGGGLASIGVLMHQQVGYGSLWGFFGNPASEVSAHFWIARSGTVEQYVDTSTVAWHAMHLNGAYCGIEFEGMPTDPITDAQVTSGGAVLAEGHARHGWPLVLVDAAYEPGFGYHRMQGGVNTACPSDLRLSARSAMLAEAGGAHPASPSKKKGREMIASTSTGKGYWTTTSDGALYAFGDAEGLGGVYPKKINGEIIGIAGKGTDGVWLLASDGGIFAFGSADFHGRPDRT
jgi:hypothetical protein